MRDDLQAILPGVALVFAELAFGLVLGVLFDLDGRLFGDFIVRATADHWELFDKAHPGEMWRYIHAAHSHATGMAAFSLGLLVLTMCSSLGRALKRLVSILIGLGGLYPFTWLTVFLLAPGLGPVLAREHAFTLLLKVFGLGGLLLGLGLLAGNLFFGLFGDRSGAA